MLPLLPINDCHIDDALLTAAIPVIMTFIVVICCLWCRKEYANVTDIFLSVDNVGKYVGTQVMVRLYLL